MLMIRQRLRAVEHDLNERSRHLLMWVSQSHAKLASALREAGHKISDSSIPKLLGLLEYCRKVNRKTLEGSDQPDRNAPFGHINAAVIATRDSGQPVISIDTKKQELIGAFKNSGNDYREQGCPDAVNMHAFVDQGLGNSRRTSFTTSLPRQVVSVLASAMTPRSSPSIRSAAG